MGQQKPPRWDLGEVPAADDPGDKMDVDEDVLCWFRDKAAQEMHHGNFPVVRWSQHDSDYSYSQQSSPRDAPWEVPSGWIEPTRL